MNMVINGSDSTKNNAVRASLTVNNPLPALGGRDEPSIEEMRNLVRYNFSSQNRAVTIKDYHARISAMPSKFGVPFRMGVSEEQNKIKIYIMNVDGEGKLSNKSTTTLQENIVTYLSDYRMLNDYIQISNGRIINIGFQIDLFIDKQFSQAKVISQTISEVQKHMDINNFDMGENIYLSNLLEKINNVPGVLNVIDLRVYNKIGGKYSNNEISQPFADAPSREIDILNDYTLFGEPQTMYEVKYPNTDIVVRVK
jgi:uncharacterized phage protein gp47/JayE